MAEEGYYLDARQVDRLRRGLRILEGKVDPSPLQRKRALFERNVSQVTFRNDYAGTIPAYGVVQITGVASSDGVQVFTVDRPGSALYRLCLVNGPEDVAEDAFGWGTFLWHADWVLYDDADTPAFGESWGPQNASFKLKKWRYGFTIWGAPTGGTTDLVMASQDWVNEFLCKADADIAAGSSGTVSVYDGNDADTSINVSSVTNRTGVDWTSGDWGISYWLGGKWKAEPWECAS